MHQRRSGHAATGIPPGGDVDVVATTTITRQQQQPPGVKKRRKRQTGGGRNSNKSRRLALQLRQLLQDEDTLITLIQAVSVIILMGCGITLMLHYFGAPSDFQAEDDAEAVARAAAEAAATSSSWWNGVWSAFAFLMHPSGGAGMFPSKRHRNANGLYPRMDFPPSRIYEIPGSLSFVGDKTDHYAELRKEFDAKMDDLPDIEQQYVFDAEPMNDGDSANDDHILPEPYDIYNCPEQPPKHYPYDWNLLKILNHWQPDDPTVPEDRRLYQGLCVFDFERDYDKARNYRRKELPFVVINDPQVKDTVKRWNAPGYMDRMLGNVKHRAEYSESNHFLYWNKPAAQRKGVLPRRNKVGRVRQQRDNPLVAPEADANLKDWKEPTTMMRMTYQNWLEHANLTATGDVVGPDDPHYYFRLIGCGETGPEGECDRGSSEYLFDELPFFQPRETLYVVDPMEQKGIHCRFGMHGVIAENHFDQSRNAIVVLGGERRYVLAHPNQCKFMILYPKGHPSARHSAVDWSDPDLDSYPEFAGARANEVVLQPGDVLYLPTDWFHYIISLNLNFQCNTRSGVTPEYLGALRQCGF